MMLGNFSFRRLMMRLASSTDSVVCVRYANLDLGGISRRVDFFDGADQMERFRGFAHRADDFVVAGVADEDDLVALLGIANRFQMNFGHQRAGGVDRFQASLLGDAADFRGDAVRGEQQVGPFGDFVQIVDEDGPFVAEALDHVLVVDDFVIDVDRRAENAERLFERVDRHVDAGTETAGAGENDFHEAELFSI